MITEGQEYQQIAHIQYKYKAISDFHTQTRIRGFEVDLKFLRLMANGNLQIKSGYACDGCSGPTMDDDSNIHAGFAHDGLYQLLRLGKLAVSKKDFDKVRKLADLSFRDQLKRDGMTWFRRNYYYWGVRAGGKKHALPRGNT